MTTLALILWCVVTAVPLIVGVLLRWPHVVVPAWQRPEQRRSRVGGVLVVAALWCSPAWQLPVSAWSADRDLERFLAMKGAGRDEVLAVTGVDIADSPTDDAMGVIVRDVWAGRWYAPLTVRTNELISLDGERLLTARSD